MYLNLVKGTSPKSLKDTPDPGKGITSSPAPHDEEDTLHYNDSGPLTCQLTSVCVSRTDRQRNPTCQLLSLLLMWPTQLVSCGFGVYPVPRLSPEPGPPLLPVQPDNSTAKLSSW